jgi:Recombinase zinc beta ribbon domain
VLWNRVQAIRGGSRKAGQHSQGPHLLVRGALRCGLCGSAMIPDRGRGRRDRCLCRGRVEHGSAFCSQASVLRECIDEPFLAQLLDDHIDLDASRQRIERRASSALEAVREQVAHAERDAAKAEATLEKVRDDYRSGDLDAATWNEERLELTAQVEAAQQAVQRTQEHVQQVEMAGVPGDADQVLVNHLARLRAAVDIAPDLHALRNVIGDLFESVDLVPNDDGSYVLMPLVRVNRLPGGRCDFEGATSRRELPIDAVTKLTG